MGSRYLVMLVVGTAVLILHDVNTSSEAEVLRAEAVERTRRETDPEALNGFVMIVVVHTETKL